VFPSLCVLITHPTEGALLYDTGYAPGFFAATQSFPERLYRWTTPATLPPSQSLEAQLGLRGLRLSDIRTCLISHFHADHIAGLRSLPAARFICMRDDFASLAGASRFGRLRRGFLSPLLPDDFEARVGFADGSPAQSLTGAWASLGKGYDLLGDGSLMAVPLPGHAPSQMGVCLEDAVGRAVLLCADAVWSRQAWQDLDLPAWPTRLVMHDWQDYRCTLLRLHELARHEPGVVILPSHCQESIEAYRAASGGRP
jgi:glyoxylase-like metal-dependent hydrolase (beta-lactamase superfamily II)